MRHSRAFKRVVCIGLLVLVLLGAAVGWYLMASSAAARTFLMSCYTWQYDKEAFPTDLPAFYAELQAEYADRMTERAFEISVTNRYIPTGMFIAQVAGTSVVPTDIRLTTDSFSLFGGITYAYEIDLSVKMDASVPLTGEITLVPKTFRWLVDLFRPDFSF